MTAVETSVDQIGVDIDRQLVALAGEIQVCATDPASLIEVADLAAHIRDHAEQIRQQATARLDQSRCRHTLSPVGDVHFECTACGSRFADGLGHRRVHHWITGHIRGHDLSARVECACGWESPPHPTLAAAWVAWEHHDQEHRP